MNDREHARHIKQFDALAEKWKFALFLGNWALITDHFREGDGKTDAATGKTPAASCSADWRYMHVKLSCNCFEFADMPAHEVERIVIHELLHAVVHEMREWSENDDSCLPHEERVVSHLTAVIDYLANAPRKRR